MSQLTFKCSKAITRTQAVSSEYPGETLLSSQKFLLHSTAQQHQASHLQTRDFISESPKLYKGVAWVLLFDVFSC